MVMHSVCIIGIGCYKKQAPCLIITEQSPENLTNYSEKGIDSLYMYIVSRHEYTQPVGQKGRYDNLGVQGI